MEKKFLKETSQLDSLLERHKQLQERSAFKSFCHSQGVESDTNITCNENSLSGLRNHALPDEQPLMSKVYVNPNYTRRKTVIHINPRVQVKSSIYVNPKLIKNITNTQNQEQIPQTIAQIHQPFIHTNLQNKCSVHINPKMMNKLISQIPEKNKIMLQKSNVANSKIIESISNDSFNFCGQNKSIASLSPCIKNKSIDNNSKYPQRKLSTNYIIRSKTKLVINNSNLKKSSNSTLIALSRRKLIRIKKSPKSATAAMSSTKFALPFRKKFSSSGLKKIRISPKSTNSKIQFYKINHLKFMSSIDKYKLNWYNKIDKNLLKQSYKKKLVPTKKLLNNSISFVSIGGITYKTSRNQLIRSNFNISPIKRRRSLTSYKSIHYHITKNGKKLLKLDLSKKRIYSDPVKFNTPILPIKSYKVTVSNKVKQRSLQILRNKMHKNNQPCLLFQRFGYCTNQLTDTCPKVHDKKQVALCRNFLQGKCLLDSCPLSHNVGPEKMPTCKYFLEGCCTRDGCPYLHVKVSSKNPICVEFLRGYCSQGNECYKRHINVCPEFDKSGRCSRGKSCPYPHKSQLTKIKRFKGSARSENNTSVKQLKKILKSSPTLESRKRYYNELTENLSEKKEKLLRKIKLAKKAYISQLNECSEEKGIDFQESDITSTTSSKLNEEKIETVSRFPKRPPIGPLPAYIPIE